MNYFNFSATSSEPFYKQKKSQRGGGNESDKLIARALLAHNYEALLFLVEDPNIELTATNENKQTLLHLLIDIYEKSPKIDQIINCILSRSDINKIINQKDSNGNTALHLAVMKNLHTVCDKLVKAGADCKIRNEAGLLVESVTETQTEDAQITDVSIKSEYDNHNLIPHNLSETSVQDGGSIKSSNIFLKHNSANSVKSKNSSATSTAKGFTEFLNNTITMTGGNKNNFSEYSELINTSDFINDFIKNNVHSGGAKKSAMEIPNSITSTFKMESTESEESNNSMSEMSELARMINNQASEIHERVVKKILELLKEINSKATEQEARAIKAIIYNQVKESNPELNNFDRAVEMEKQITKDTIKNIDNKKIKEITNIMAEKQKEKLTKQESTQESSEKLKKKATKKATKTTKATETTKKETKSKKPVARTKTTKKTKKSKKFIGEGMIDKSSESSTTLGPDTDSNSSDTLSTTDSSSYTSTSD